MMKHIAQSDASHNYLARAGSVGESQFFETQRRKGSSDFTKFEEISEPVGDSAFFQPPRMESFLEVFISGDEALENVVATLNNSQITEQIPRIDFDQPKYTLNWNQIKANAAAFQT